MLQVDVEQGELVWGGEGGGGSGAEVQRSLALTTKSLMELNTASAYATTVMRPLNGQRKRHHAQQYSKHAMWYSTDSKPTFSLHDIANNVDICQPDQTPSYSSCTVFQKLKPLFGSTLVILKFSTLIL
jgi:hypothetical protein